MEYTDSAQCFNNYWNNKISRETVIYDIILIYYFLSVVFAHKSLKSNIKQFLLGINEQIDMPSDNLTPKEKFESLINVLNFGMKILYLTIYTTIGIFIKTWAIFNLQKSITNINTYFSNNNYVYNQMDFTQNYMISGMMIYTIVSFFYDKSISKRYLGMKILSLFKDMLIGIIIFSNESNIVDLIKYTFYLSIRFELTSWLIMLLIQ